MILISFYASSIYYINCALHKKIKLYLTSLRIGSQLYTISYILQRAIIHRYL